MPHIPDRSLTAHRNGVGKDAEVRCGVIVKPAGCHSINFVTRQYACCWVVRGFGHYRDDRGTHPLEPGIAFQRQPNRVHDIFLEGPAAWFFVAVPAPVTAVFSTCGIPSLMHCSPVFDPGMDNALMFRWKMLTRKLADTSHERLALVTVDFIQLIVDLHMRAFQRQQPHRHSDAIDKACQLMNDDIEARISMPELASAVELNYNTFRALFSAHTGMSPQAWRMRLRLDKAKEMLSESHVAIAEVARKLGWNDPLDFSACFRRHTGRSPRAFRSELGVH